MTIHSSSALEVQQLVAELREADPSRRDAAVARLRVLGSRALGRLSVVIRQDSPRARRAALRALDGIDDPAVVDIALRAMSDSDEDVRIGAIAALRPWVVREEGTRVMEGLVMAALEAGEPARVRRAALEALSQLPREIVQPIVERAALGPADPAERAVDDPAAVHDLLGGEAAAPLSSLHDLVAQVRAREGRETDAAQRHAWLVARGALHAALARRDSRVALYDLRETFGAATAPLPLDFLQAIAVIGDATCLEPIARAWAAAPPAETWWRTRLSETARALVTRHRLTARHAAIKRLRARWPGFIR